MSVRVRPSRPGNGVPGVCVVGEEVEMDSVNVTGKVHIVVWGENSFELRRLLAALGMSFEVW